MVPADHDRRNTQPGITLCQAVATVWPRVTADPDNFVPDALTVARALRRVREGAPAASAPRRRPRRDQEGR
jgi:hypothetical protein